MGTERSFKVSLVGTSKPKQHGTWTDGKAGTKCPKEEKWEDWQERRDRLSSVQFSHSVVSDPLRPHESQHTRPPCPSPTPGIHSTSCPSSWWCHPAISSSVITFSSCPQSLPASDSFPMSQLFTWGGQSIGVSALAILPRNTQDWSPLEWTCWRLCCPKEGGRESKCISVPL